MFSQVTLWLSKLIMLLNCFPFRTFNSPEFSYKFGTTLTLLPYFLTDFLTASGNEHVTCIDIGHVGNEKCGVFRHLFWEKYAFCFVRIGKISSFTGKQQTLLGGKNCTISRHPTYNYQLLQFVTFLWNGHRKALKRPPGRTWIFFFSSESDKRIPHVRATKSQNKMWKHSPWK